MFRVETASTILNNGEISVNLTDSGDFASFTHTTTTPPATRWCWVLQRAANRPTTRQH
eukprot:m.111837 g.111837  ORF g.111837 m.111837 type:complete len:58 (-) comp12950_c0_seq1:4859-5032(-)